MKFSYVHLLECDGTKNGPRKLVNAWDRDYHYNMLVQHYNRNCTKVVGNLEITHVPSGRSLEFLNTIREITGYFLVASNGVKEIKLENLMLIRGEQFVSSTNNYSVFVFQNGFLENFVLPKLKGYKLFNLSNNFQFSKFNLFKKFEYFFNFCH